MFLILLLLETNSVNLEFILVKLMLLSSSFLPWSEDYEDKMASLTV